MEFLSYVLAEAASRHNLQFLVAQPMYRRQPLWYRSGLTDFLTSFSDAFCPRLLQTAVCFPTLEFESDGLHLTVYSELYFIVHLIESASDVLRSVPFIPFEGKTSEAVRPVSDHLTVLEQDHLRLSSEFSMKFAINIEY